MTICEKCKDKVCLKTKKPCEEVEKLLPQMTDGLNFGEGDNLIILDTNYLDQHFTNE